MDQPTCSTMLSQQSEGNPVKRPSLTQDADFINPVSNLEAKRPRFEEGESPSFTNQNDKPPLEPLDLTTPYEQPLLENKTPGETYVSIETGEFCFERRKVSFVVSILNKTLYFSGYEAAKLLDFSQPRDSVSVHVNDSDKITWQTLASKVFNAKRFQHFRSHEIFITEAGFRSLIRHSTYLRLNEFQKWFETDCLPVIEKHRESKNQKEKALSSKRDLITAREMKTEKLKALHQLREDFKNRRQVHLVPKTQNKRAQPTFAVFKLGDIAYCASQTQNRNFKKLTVNLSSNDDIVYYALRIQKKRFNISVRKLKEKFPTAEKLHQFDYNANPIIFFNRLKESFDLKLKWCGNFFLLCCSEEEFIREINDLQQNDDILQTPQRYFRDHNVILRDDYSNTQPIDHSTKTSINLEDQKFSFNGTAVSFIIDPNNRIFFKASSSSRIMGYSNVDDALSHVQKEDKTSRGALFDAGSKMPSEYVRGTVFISQAGLQTLFDHTDKQDARDFQTWIDTVFIPLIECVIRTENPTANLLPSPSIQEADVPKQILSFLENLQKKSEDVSSPYVDLENQEIHFRENKVAFEIDTNKVFYFLGNEVVSMLGYLDPKRALRSNVDKGDQITYKELVSRCSQVHHKISHPHTVFLPQSCLRSLVDSKFISSNRDAAIFREWLKTDLLPVIENQRQRPTEEDDDIQDWERLDAHYQTELANVCRIMENIDKEFSEFTTLFQTGHCDVTPKTEKEELWHKFVLFRFFDDKMRKNTYIVVRVQMRTLGRTTKKIKTRYPTVTEILCIDDNSSSMNLFIRLKERLCNTLEWRGNKFTIKDEMGFGEDLLLEEIQKLHNEGKCSLKPSTVLA